MRTPDDKSDKMYLAPACSRQHLAQQFVVRIVERRSVVAQERSLRFSMEI
jgi:hypothetical protein